MSDTSPGRITLRERTEQHVRIFFEQAQRPDIQSVLPLRAQTVDEALADFRQTLLPGATSYGRTIYLDDAYVGDIWCYCIAPADDPQAMLSYCVFDRTAQNRGVATQAAALFLSELSSRFGLNRIGAFTYLSNPASVRVLEKNGFILAEIPEPGSGYFTR